MRLRKLPFLLLVAVPAASAVTLTRTQTRLVLSNSLTKVVVDLQGGLASDFAILDLETSTELARIRLGGQGRWVASCSGRADRESGTVQFRNLDTRQTGQTPRFREDSFLQVEVREADRFPWVRFRLKVTGFDAPAWEKAMGVRQPVSFLSCSLDAASAYYVGGFQIPLPQVDAFPFQSVWKSAKWLGGWFRPLALGRCPVPAIGLSGPGTPAFLVYEFQKARSLERSSRSIVADCRASGKKNASAQFALLIPEPSKPLVLESVFHIFYSWPDGKAGGTNEQVLRHIFQKGKGPLAAVPRTNDLGWLPKWDGPEADAARGRTLLRRVRKGTLEAESQYLTAGALVVQGSYRGTRNLLRSKNVEWQKRLREDWTLLKSLAVRKQIGGDDCVFWRFPVQGDYEDWVGQKSAATEDNAQTWSVGASLLAMYQIRGEAALLEWIDGILRWTRHSKSTRAGEFAQPGVSSSPAAVRASTDFLLHYYQTFRNHSDPVRRALAEEALLLGRQILFRNLAIYAGDPDESDALDPSFLVQADNAPASFGTVSWEGTGEVLRAMALYGVETGDVLLLRLLRGALRRWPVGWESDGLHTIERLDVFGTGPGTRGARLGLRFPGPALAEYFQPFGSAPIRVLAGRRSALTFSNRPVRVELRGYRSRPAGNLAFKLITGITGPVDVIITCPFLDLRGKKVRCNSRIARTGVVGVSGENFLVRGVRNGDLITVGDASGVSPSDTQARVATSAVRGLEPAFGNYQPVGLPARHPSIVTLSRDWADGLSWAGLVPAIHFAYGVPFRVPGGDVPAWDASRGPVVLNCSRKFGAGYLFASSSRIPPTLTTIYEDAPKDVQQLGEHLPALSPGPLRNWRIDVFPFKLKRPGSIVKSLHITGQCLILALTTHATGSRVFEAELAKRHARQRAAIAAAEAEKERTRVLKRIVPDSRKKVAAAVRGKLLRIAFLPPHEAYTEVLSKACIALGVRPVMLSEENVVNPAEFNAARYPIAVYSASETFLHTVKKPGDAAKATTDYLAHGGCLISAARGFPFYYQMKVAGDNLERIKGIPHAKTCGELEIPINSLPMPKLLDIPRYKLVPGQKMFSHLPPAFRFDAAAGGPYRPVRREGLPPEDKFTPFLTLGGMKDKTGQVIAAEIVHGCARYKGGHVLVIWGNVLGQAEGPTIAIDLMAYAVCSIRLKDAARQEPRVAVLPRDQAGHEKAIANACAKAGLKTHILSPVEFVDPAVFNPRNFPIAIHAVRGEDFLNEYEGHKELWRVYVDYVTSGGLLVTCGNMWQFYYGGTLSRTGQWRQRHDPEQLVLTSLGLRGGFGFNRDRGDMFLKCLPGQDMLRFKSPMPIPGIHYGFYRAISGAGEAWAEFTPVAQVVTHKSESFGGYAIASLRFKKQGASGGEVLWFWGNLLDLPQTHPLLEQLMKYARKKRAAAFP